MHASAPLLFAGLKPYPQPSDGGPVNPTNTDLPSNVTWRPVWMNVGEENLRNQKPIGYEEMIGKIVEETSVSDIMTGATLV